ncbi:MAG: hypothetical protein INR69_21570 [Mucilaginibacter polytrichastri]|nr:hypothetical protein [Mucilaginibacter polytrichastri]
MAKRFFIGLVLWLSASAASAQYNFYNVAVSVSGGPTRPYDDLTQYQYKHAFSAIASYFYTPYVEFTGEAQFGQVAGGDNIENRHRRQYANSYKSFIFSANLQLGEITDYEDSRFLYRMRGLYGGAGMGVIYNKMTFVQRVKPDGTNYVFPGKDQSMNFSMPFRLGYQFKIFDSYQEPRYLIDLGYTMHVTFGEGLDGYNDSPSMFENFAPDMYSQVYISFKYAFGFTAAYRKPIRF